MSSSEQGDRMGELGCRWDVLHILYVVLTVKELIQEIKHIFSNTVLVKNPILVILGAVVTIDNKQARSDTRTFDLLHINSLRAHVTVREASVNRLVDKDGGVILVPAELSFGERHIVVDGVGSIL